MTSRPEQQASWIHAERDRDNDASFETLCEQQESIKTREDLASFVQALSDDVRAHPTWWENTALDSYLDALVSVTESLDQRFKNHGETLPEQPTWRLVGDLLLTARIYE